jgi:predicted ATP-dependent serine protease
LLAEVDNLHIMPHLDITKLSELEAELEDFQPQLVVIDSLTTICLSLGVSEKDPSLLGTSTNSRLTGSLQRSRHYYTPRE